VSQHALNLFGLNFKDTAKSDSTAQLPPEARQAAAEICELSRAVEEQHRVGNGLKQRLEDAKLMLEKQAAKRKLAEKEAGIAKSRLQKCNADLGKEKAKRSALLEQIHRNREQCAIMEYLDMPHGSLRESFLSKMAATMLDPASLLTEVTRLRDHHRAMTTKLQKESVRISHLESRNRRELGEAQRSVADYQKKLERCDANERLRLRSLQQATELALPDKKRQRLLAE